MKEERLAILNMLNEGKINADEAVRLLDTLAKGGGPEQKKNKANRHYAHVEFDEGEMEERFKKFAQAAENFSREFGEKVSGTFKDFEPKFKKTAKTVMEKTASVVDDLAKALNESVKNMEQKLNECCEEDCCDGNDDCCKDDDCGCGCCDDTPKEN